MQIIFSFILKGFRSPSLFKCRKKCISSEVTVSHLPCQPRIHSQARESITNLKISDEAAQKCFTSNTFFFKAKQEMHGFRMDSHHQRAVRFCPGVGNIPTLIQKCYEGQWRIASGFKYLLTASIHVIKDKKDWSD